MTKPLTKEDFVPHIGKAFHFEGSETALILDRIIDYPPHPGQERAPFVAVFTGPPQPVVSDGIYDARVDTGETLCFAMQPMLTPTRERQDYQAIFN